MPGVGLIALFCGVAFVSVSVAPVLVYGGSLALFGLAHVSSELAYVRARFARRWPRGWWIGVAGLLAAVVVVRIVRSWGGGWGDDWGGLGAWVSGTRGQSIELSLVALLALAGATLLRGAGLARQLAGAAVVIGLGAGALLAPLATLLVLAALHNLTPVGFLLERAPVGQRRRVLLGSAAAFVVLPLALLSGGPWRLLGAMDPNQGALAGTELASTLGAWFPGGWHLEPWILFAFQAVVLLQVLHYGAVIHLLPRTLPPARRPKGLAVAVVVGICAALALGFFQDFFGARRIYGVAAAVHAWLEVPVLLAALLGGQREVARTATARRPLAT